MSLAAELQKSVDIHFDEKVDIRRADQAPTRDSVPLGLNATQLEATVLSVDIRQYSGMTNALGRQLVVKMLKSFFDGSVRLVLRNDGQVADFNGDGMIAVFTGANRTENAVRAACQMKWFLHEVLRAKFDAVFQAHQVIEDKIASFDAGYGIDDGIILVSKVGVETYSDFAWVGRCVNTAAKLCKIAKSPDSIIITRDSYDRLGDDAGFSLELWKPGGISEVGGVKREVLITTQMCPVD